jgi:hypothetical protein
MSQGTLSRYAHYLIKNRRLDSAMDDCVKPTMMLLRQVAGLDGAIVVSEKAQPKAFLI